MVMTFILHFIEDSHLRRDWVNISRELHKGGEKV